MKRRISLQLSLYRVLLIQIAVGFCFASISAGCSGIVDIHPRPTANEDDGTRVPIDIGTGVIDPQSAGSLVSAPAGQAGGANALIWTMNGQELLLAQYTGLARYNPGSKGLAPQAIQDARQQIRSTNPTLLTADAVSPVLAWVNAGRQVYTWNPTTQAIEQSVAESEFPITGLAISPGGQRMAYINVRGELNQLGLSQSGAAIAPQVESPGGAPGITSGPFQVPAWLTQLSYSPDARLIGGTDPGSFTVYILDAQTGEIQRTLDWVDSPVASLYGAFFSPNWDQVAWVAQSQVQLMDLETAKPGPLLGHADTVNVLAWSPDGRLIATASAAIQGDALIPSVYIWDALKGDLVAQLNQSGAVVSLSFSPEGRRLAMLDGSGNISVWSASQ